MDKFPHIILLFLLTSISVSSYSQSSILKDSTYLKAVNDSVNRYIKNHPNRFKPKQNKLQLVPIGAVNYTQEDGWGFFAGAIGTYRNGFDTTTPLSSVATVGYASTKQAYKGVIAGNNYNSSGKGRLEYKLSAYQRKDLFWGLGYSNGIDNSNKGRYLENGAALNIGYRFFLSPHISIATSVGFEIFKSKDFTHPAIIDGLPTSSGGGYIGLNFEFNTKDNQSIPTSGSYINISQKSYPIRLYQAKPYFQTVIIGDYFISPWEGGVVALDCYMEYNYGDSPWQLWTPLGGETRMRGYYYGRYRDRNSIIAQVELRQTIYKWHGMVIWGGGGNIFPTFRDFDIKHTLPNYGVGYRFTLGMIVIKGDIGFGLNGEYGIIAGFSHSF